MKVGLGTFVGGNAGTDGCRGDACQMHDCPVTKHADRLLVEPGTLLVARWKRRRAASRRGIGVDAHTFECVTKTGRGDGVSGLVVGGGGFGMTRSNRRSLGAEHIADRGDERARESHDSQADILGHGPAGWLIAAAGHAHEVLGDRVAAEPDPRRIDRALGVRAALVTHHGFEAVFPELPHEIRDALVEEWRGCGGLSVEVRHSDSSVFGTVLRRVHLASGKRPREGATRAASQRRFRPSSPPYARVPISAPPGRQRNAGQGCSLSQR